MKNDKQFNFSDLLGIIGNSDKQAKQNIAGKMIDSLDKNESRQLNDIMNDKDKIDAILNSTAAQKIINKININRDGQHK